jgi:oxalate decarboxylase/phosphoglucose isomerase-like protein (cupin superfamily)
MLVENSTLYNRKKGTNLYDNEDDKYKKSQNKFSTYKTPIILSILVVFIFYFLFSKFISSGENKSTLRLIGKVPVENWNHQIPKEQFVQEVYQSKIPILLKDAPIKDWKANLWTPDYIKQKIQLLDRVAMQQDSNIFVYEERYRPMAGLKKVLRKSPKQWKTMLTEDFFHAMENEKSHYYYSAKINAKNGFGKLQDDVKGDFFLLPNPRNISMKPQYSSVNVWIGKNVITHAHYDASPNFYVQLYGKKKFILFAPEQYKNLYLHPFAHPKDRQSEVNFENPNYKLFPNYRKAKAIEVTLEKGDVLYLPPYWFHRVESLDLSISVNVWSESIETVMTPMVHLAGLPKCIDQVPTSQARNVERITRAVAYLRLLIREVTGKSDKNFIHDVIIENRYQAIFDTLKCHDEFDHEKCPMEGIIHNEELEEIKLHVQKMGFEFDKLRKAQEGVLDIILGDYVEKVSAHVVGVDNLCYFVRCMLHGYTHVNY